MGEEIDAEYTLKEISEKLSIPQETCRQVLLVALRKLKSKKHIDQLQEALETLNEIDIHKG